MFSLSRGACQGKSSCFMGILNRRDVFLFLQAQLEDESQEEQSLKMQGAMGRQHKINN
jgi:hypothetical protein